MAGGKETPRQKMIGMMYLVLTALLALNVSKAILDAFVAIEENTQKANITQYERGLAFKSALVEEMSTTTKDEAGAEKKKKIKFYLDMIDKIDAETAKLIQEIDGIKLDILEKSGENISEYKDMDEETILWKKYDKSKALLPIRMNLMAVQAKDQYDVPMHEIIGEDIKNPTGSGLTLWNNYNKYRKFVCETLGTYKIGGKSWSFKAKDINDHKDNADLVKRLQKMIASSKVNPEDVSVIEQLYAELSKQEIVNSNEGETAHWIGKTFDHSPLVAAIASLSAMEQEILSARATAVGHLKGKVSTGEYSFNKIMPLAYGPSIANANEEIELQVMMAAFDSDNQPTVTYNGATIQDVKDGYGTVKVKTSGGTEMVLTGTVAIRNKSGVEKKEKWSHTVKIMKPEGTVSLPEMNMLYRGYDNKVEGVASGYDQTVLSGNNVTLAKQAKGYIGKPGSGKSCTISIGGKNSVTNKTVSLGVFTFRVSNLPPAQIYFGNATNGGPGSKVETKLFAKYPPEIPLNVSFTVLSYEMEFMGRTAKAPGGRLDPAAQGLLKQAKPGANVTFIVKYVGPDKVQRTGVCAVKL